MKALLKALCWALVVALPIVLLFGLKHFEARELAATFIIIAALRLALVRDTADTALPWVLPATLLVLAVAVSLSGESRWFRCYPLLVNASFLGLFGMSLWRGQPVVERLARLRDPQLPAAAIAYTRRVTQVWCVFFVVNGSIAGYTAVFSSLPVWAWYNGGVAYALMGLLFAGEWLVRRRVMRAQHA